MKNFYIKLFSIFIFIILILNYIYNSFLKENIENLNKIISLSERENRIFIRDKVRNEIKRAIEKDEIFSKEDKIILYKFYKKIQNEFKDVSESK